MTIIFPRNKNVRIMDNKRHFIRHVLERNWFKRDGNQAKWSFSDDLNGMTENEIIILLNVIFECITCNSNKRNFGSHCNDFLSNGFCMLCNERIDSKYIERCMMLLTLSEFRLHDATLYPPGLRMSAISQTAKETGLNEDLVLRVDQNWHTRVRGTVWGEESQG